MTLRPNSLFYWLPLLLFGWATPNLSAQTWTTVWTPGSVPATRAGTGSTNRYYNTNCYPCMMWDTYANNGKGKWEPMPLGTDPIRCKGDTNDYTCKICDDGLGNVTNAPATTACDAGHGCGCCVDGNCWAPTNNCNDPMDVNIDFFKVGSCSCGPESWDARGQPIWILGFKQARALRTASGNQAQQRYRWVIMKACALINAKHRLIRPTM